VGKIERTEKLGLTAHGTHERWRIIETYRAVESGGSLTLDSDPKEVIVYHAAGDGGFGTASYIDAVVLRDRDATSTSNSDPAETWLFASDGVLEERVYYLQDWHQDVVQLVEERLWSDFENDGDYDQLLLVAQNIWGQRYIDDLIARRVQHGYDDSGWVEPDGSWHHEHLSLTLTDSMFSVRQIIGDDWGDTSRSKWMRERSSLEIDYAAYGEPDAIVGVVTDPWVDFTGDGTMNFADTQAFLSLFSANDAKADRDADSDWDAADVDFFLADAATGSASLTPTGREDEEENPFGLAGYRHDAITGLYHVRNRVLDPEQGKWLQRDPAGFVDGGSVYTYGRCSPMIARDPFGLWVVRRNHGPWAHATTEELDARYQGDPYDTLAELSRELGLDPQKFREWISSNPDPLETPDGEVAWSDASGREALCPGHSFGIPNMIILVRTAGYRPQDKVYELFNLHRVNKHGRNLESMGYAVAEFNSRGILAYITSFEGWLTDPGDTTVHDNFIWGFRASMKLKTLFGVYIDAHGGSFGWYTNGMHPDTRVTYDEMSAITKGHYGLSVAYWATCYSDAMSATGSGASALMSPAFRAYFARQGTFDPYRHHVGVSDFEDPTSIQP
jgi:RHS repeat-associated protein